jgi:hypothetical protein
MWDCEHCGTQAIAGTITICPVCLTPRNQDVSAEPLSPDASAPTEAAVGDREAPQTPDGSDEGDWGKPDGKNK